jgi:hypothetical protein
MSTTSYFPGEFVYLPSDTLIFIVDDETSFSKCQRLSSSSYLMFLEENQFQERCFNVFYDGKIWSVNQDDVYER